MNTPYTTCCGQLANTPKKWLIHCFIGSSVQPTRAANIDELQG